jgi:hypothetical protein
MRPSISIAITGLACFSTYVSAQPSKQLYELQERCGRHAAEVFQREYGPGADRQDEQTLFTYENHYSARLNKCFFLEIAISNKPTSSKIMRLLDLNRNKVYGTFVSGPTEPLACALQGKACRSESEWRQLLKPFMED